MNEQEIYDFFGEKNYWLFDEKKAKIKGNLYDKYFEGTCSLINYKSELIIDIIGKNNLSAVIICFRLSFLKIFRDTSPCDTFVIF